MLKKKNKLWDRVKAKVADEITNREKNENSDVGIGGSRQFCGCASTKGAGL
jgi:hypothetical protein